MNHPTEFDPHKLRETALFFADLPPQPAFVDCNAVGSLVYFADTLAYRRYGASITGSEYRKMPAGPLPANLPQAYADLAATGSIRSDLRFTHTRVHTTVCTQRPFDASAFNEDELAILNEVKSELRNYDDASIVAEANAEIGIRAVTLFGRIPYFNSRTSPEPLAQTEIDLGRLIAAGVA